MFFRPLEGAVSEQQGSGSPPGTGSQEVRAVMWPSRAGMREAGDQWACNIPGAGTGGPRLGWNGPPSPWEGLGEALGVLGRASKTYSCTQGLYRYLWAFLWRPETSFHSCVSCLEQSSRSTLTWEKATFFLTCCEIELEEITGMGKLLQLVLCLFYR